MDGYGLHLALVAVLVLLNAVFAGNEMALISLREGQHRNHPGGVSVSAAVSLAEPLVPDGARG